jgi:hypothetical protein
VKYLQGGEKFFGRRGRITHREGRLLRRETGRGGRGLNTKCGSRTSVVIVRGQNGGAEAWAEKERSEREGEKGEGRRADVSGRVLGQSVDASRSAQEVACRRGCGSATCRRVSSTQHAELAACDDADRRRPITR